MSRLEDYSLAEAKDHVMMTGESVEAYAERVSKEIADTADSILAVIVPHETQAKDPA